jgi:serine/threonine protein kinase
VTTNAAAPVLRGEEGLDVGLDLDGEGNRPQSHRLSSTSGGYRGDTQLKDDINSEFIQGRDDHYHNTQYHGDGQVPVVEEDDNREETHVEVKIGPQHFELLKLLGEGAFGKVILVQSRLNSQEYYAMKVISKKLLKKKNNVSYMKSERDILTKVNHPFLVSLCFAFQSKTKLFLGKSCRCFCRRLCLFVSILCHASVCLWCLVDFPNSTQLI